MDTYPDQPLSYALAHPTQYFDFDACANTYQSAPHTYPNAHANSRTLNKMILVTGGTGFVGQALLRHLVEAGHPVRTLVHPGQSPNLPRDLPIEVTLCNLDDERNMRAAMVDVEAIYHLVSVEWRGVRADLLKNDIQGTIAVLQAATGSGVKRFFYVSHLGTERASAYPVMKAKAIAEENIRRSGIDYTILRSAILYGPRDHFTTRLVKLMRLLPFIFLLPGNGTTLLQPLWVEDLAACLTWALDIDDTRNQTYEIGGPENLSFLQILTAVMENSGVRRRPIPIRPPYLRAITVLIEHIYPKLPVSTYLLDYLATNRTCALDTIPRVFKLMPSRFAQRLAYLRR